MSDFKSSLLKKFQYKLTPNRDRLEANLFTLRKWRKSEYKK